MNPTKFPAMVLCLGERLGRFLWCWLLLLFFPHWRFLRFRATFSCHRHSTLASQTREGLHQLWALRWLISVTLLSARLFRHRFTASATVLSGHFFTYWRFLPYASHRHFATVCDSDAGRNTPSRILLCAFPHRVVPCGWRMDLNYSYCSYKTIDLSIAPVSHEV